MKTALVVTTIGAPNEAMRRLAAGCRAHDIHMIVIGDRSSPPDFRLDGADYYDLERQRATGLATALAGSMCIAISLRPRSGRAGCRLRR